MLRAIAAGVLTFIVIYGALRLIEYGYHRLRHTPDWSPHWGSWLFALLAGIYMLINEFGRQ